MEDVSNVRCSSEDETEVVAAMRAVLAPDGGFEWVRSGMKIALTEGRDGGKKAADRTVFKQEYIQKLKQAGDAHQKHLPLVI